MNGKEMLDNIGNLFIGIFGTATAVLGSNPANKEIIKRIFKVSELLSSILAPVISIVTIIYFIVKIKKMRNDK